MCIINFFGKVSRETGNINRRRRRGRRRNRTIKIQRRKRRVFSDTDGTTVGTLRALRY